jgi:Na+/H+ antiporter NhaD/arsenite permease-like protein
MTPTNWFSLIIIILTLVGVAIGRYPVFRMNRATIVLVGSTILIIIGAITLDQAYSAIDLDTIVLIFAMMILNINFRLAGFFSLITSKITKLAGTPLQLLSLVIFTSGILSALFLNDTIVLMLTPLILEIVIALRLNPMPYLMALATAANIGSAATIVGNPQNMLIGTSSGISFNDFFIKLFPASFSGLFIIWLIIYIIYRKDFQSKKRFEKIEIRLRIYKPLLIKSTIAVVLMIVLFISDVTIPLAALGVASFLLFTRRLKPERVFKEVDWSILVFFSGLFIVTASIETSGLLNYLLEYAGEFLRGGIISLSLSSAVLSNLVSNVPAVMLLKPLIPLLENPDIGWLTLAMATTFAGNFTLLGSVANLIVAETAKHNGVQLSFKEYLKAGIPITILRLIVGILWLCYIPY